jgi:hypothetical protein
MFTTQSTYESTTQSTIEKTYAKACQEMWDKALAKVQVNPEKYLSDKVKGMLADLGIDIKDAQVVNSFFTHWQDNNRAKDNNGMMTIFAAYMEDVRLVAVNEKIGKAYIGQLLFADPRYNREVAMVPSGSIVIQNMKTKDGKPVTLFSPHWTFVASQLFFEQYCLKKDTTMEKSTPEQKKVLKAIYAGISKKVVEGNFAKSKMPVYANYDFIQQEEKTSYSDIMVSQYMYGNSTSTCALVATSGGNMSSLDLMSNEQLLKSGVSCVDEADGKKKMYALRFEHTNELMSKANDDALNKQAEKKRRTDAGVEETSAKQQELQEQQEQELQNSAPFSTQLPILDDNGNLIECPFSAVTTCKVQFKITKKENKSYSRSGNSSGTRSLKGGGLTRGSRITQESADDNTIDASILKAISEGITITKCTKGEELYEMPVIKVVIPDEMEITMQPGNLQIRVLVRCRDPSGDEEADADYFCNELLLNMLKARVHLMNELVKVSDSRNTTSLNKADFNHFDDKQPDAKDFLKNSASCLLKNRYDPFKAVQAVPDFEDEDFDIVAFCQSYDKTELSEPVSLQVSEPVSLQSEPVVMQSEPVVMQSESVVMQSEPFYNFVQWDANDHEATPKALMVNLGEKIDLDNISAVKFTVDVKEHDGKDDKQGERKVESDIKVFNRGLFREAVIRVEPDLLIRVTVKSSHEIKVRPVYIKENGEEEPEDVIDLHEPFELPFPLQKECGEESDSWEIRGVDDVNGKYPVLFKMTFHL